MSKSNNTMSDPRRCVSVRTRVGVESYVLCKGRVDWTQCFLVEVLECGVQHGDDQVIFVEVGNGGSHHIKYLVAHRLVPNRNEAREKLVPCACVLWAFAHPIHAFGAKLIGIKSPYLYALVG